LANLREEQLVRPVREEMDDKNACEGDRDNVQRLGVIVDDGAVGGDANEPGDGYGGGGVEDDAEDAEENGAFEGFPVCR